MRFSFALLLVAAPLTLAHVGSSWPEGPVEGVSHPLFDAASLPHEVRSSAGEFFFGLRGPRRRLPACLPVWLPPTTINQRQ